MAISASWGSHKLQQTRVWKMPPCNHYTTQWWNTSSNVGLLWKATLCFFPPWTYICLVQCKPSAAQCSLDPGSGKGVLLLKHHSKCVLLCAVAWFVLKMPPFPKQDTAAYSNLRRIGPDGDHLNQENRSLDTGSWQCILYSVMEQQPQGGFVLESNPSLFPT